MIAGGGLRSHRGRGLHEADGEQADPAQVARRAAVPDMATISGTSLSCLQSLPRMCRQNRSKTARETGQGSHCRYSGENRLGHLVWPIQTICPMRKGGSIK